MITRFLENKTLVFTLFIDNAVDLYVFVTINFKINLEFKY